MEKEEIIEKLAEFLHEFYYSELSLAYSEGKKSINVDFSLLDKFDTELADYLLENPEECLSLAEEALRQIDLPEAKLKIRFFNLPQSREIRIRNIRAEHIGKLIVVDGIVRRASEIRPEVGEAIFSCPTCGDKISIIQTERTIKSPTECECGNKKGFRLVDQKLYDARWIEIEEPFEITSGERPSEIMVFLKEDLTSPRMQSKTDPGNRIRVVGILKELPRKVKGTRSRQVDIYIDANYVESVETAWEELEITEEDEKRIKELAKDPLLFEKLIGSLAPTMYEMSEVKEAILLQLFGGVAKVLKDKTRIRGNIHILLVGDPASGKSQLMQLVSKLIPRGRYVSGSGVTAAGICTVYDTLIQLEDGTLKKIGELVENALANGFEEVGDGVYRAKVIDEIKVISFDTETLKFRPRKITYLWKIKAPKKLVKITTSTGKEIILTKENPLPTLRDGKIIWKPASKFVEGEFLATPRKLPSGNSREIPENLLCVIGSIAGDGSISWNKGTFDIKFHNTNQWLLNCHSKICSEGLNINPSYKAYGRFHSKEFGEFLEEFGILHGDKAHNIQISQKLSRLDNNSIAAFLRGLFDTNGTVVIEKKSKGRYIELTSASKKLIEGIQFLLLRFGIISSIKEIKRQEVVYKGSTTKSSKKWVLRISGLNNIKLFKTKIGFKNPIKKRALDKIFEEGKKEHTNVDVIPNIGNLIRKIRKSAKISGEILKTYDYELNRSNISVKKLKKVIKTLETLNIKVPLLKILATSDIFWDKIKKIEIIENKDYEHVYDVTVEGEHSFVANCFIIHNTATVVREEEFFGGWVLEAGALVMSNKSICCIDEFSKVSPQDRVALQEAMSMETISIAKASIVATLPAQTAILAGANPKLGRFDPYIPIREQIDIDDVLLSRFDLKFALRDIPNPELDSKVADHILRVRHFEEEEAKPIIDPEFLRKYIAYARANVHPVLTKEAGERIKNFYLEMRAKAGEEAPISITLRQYEALIRLAEASARARLAKTVDLEDAERAIRLMKISLRQFGFEPETGKIDIDRAEGLRVTAVQRSKIRIVLDVLEELEKTFGKEIPFEEVVKRAKEEGVDNAEEIIRKMQSEGMLFSPRPGIIEKV